MSPDNPPILPSAHVGKRAIAGAVLLFFVGFALTAASMHLLTGPGLALYAMERSEKLEILRRNGYPYTSAIFGSSHAHQGFDPRAFDAALAPTPLATYTFNLGIDGGSVVEERVMALAFLDHLKPPSAIQPATQPCLVMLEANAPNAFAIMYTAHPRQINILDWQTLRAAFRLPPDGYFRPNQIHHRLSTLTAAFYHAIAMGMLSDRIFRPRFDEPTIQYETVLDRRGMHHLDDRGGDRDIDRALSHKHTPPTPLGTHLSAGNAAIMEELARSPNGKRVQLAWVVMPLLHDLEQYDVYPASEPTAFGDVPIFDMARPDLYPQLYDRSLWADSQHMNARGAPLFSRLLAQQVQAWSQAHPIHGCGA
jgi:hypothetical protein